MIPVRQLLTLPNQYQAVAMGRGIDGNMRTGKPFNELKR
jgi:hypothetical protein